MAQPPVPPPQTIWLSLGHSTLNVRPPDSKWLRRQMTAGKALQVLAPAQGKVGALIVPVFDDGRAIYQTAVAPFKGRNVGAMEDEKALRELLKVAAQKKVPVYLGVDVLGWQKSNTGKSGDLFTKYPQWQERNRHNALAAKPEARYASPFSAPVRGAMSELVRELGRKFPNARGVVLDVRLSGGEILGYSETARAASIVELGLDPIDLNISDQANAIIDAPVRQWIEWRRKTLRAFVQSLNVAYRGANAKGEVWANGFADYYSQQSFNDYRSAQDWRDWLQNTGINGVLLEGRWMARYLDSSYLARLIQTAAPAATETVKPVDLAKVIAVSHGSALIPDSEYQRDWNALKSRFQTLSRLSLVARGDDDLKRAVALASGSVMLSQRPLPQIGSLAPDWMLTDANGKTHQARDFRGQSPTLWLLGGANLSPTLRQWFAQNAPDLKAQGTQPLSFSLSPNEARDENVLSLLDRSGEMPLLYGPSPLLLSVDKAGWIRGVQVLAGEAAPQLASLPLGELQIGASAPNFQTIDMNGKRVELESFKSKRNVLLTFFPKCFTGGCANHLSSLRDSIAELQASETEVLAVSIDPADVQIAFAERWNLPFSLIPDTGRQLSMLFGAARDSEQLAERQSVFIDKSGTVRWIDKQVQVSTHGADVVAKIRAGN